MSYWRNVNSARGDGRRGSREGDRELLATLRHHSQRSDVRSRSSDRSREGFRDIERERDRDRSRERSRDIFPHRTSHSRSHSREGSYYSPAASYRGSTPRSDYISVSRSRSRDFNVESHRSYRDEYPPRDYAPSSTRSQSRGRDDHSYAASLRRSPSRERSPRSRDIVPSSTRSRSRDGDRIPSTTRSLSRESSREGAWQQRYLSSRYSLDRERERARTFETQNVQKLLEVLKKEKDRHSQLAEERESLRDARSECSLAEVMTQRTVRSVRSRDTRGVDSLTPRSTRTGTTSAVGGADRRGTATPTTSSMPRVKSVKTNKGSSTSGMDGVSAEELERLRKRNEEWVKEKMKQKKDDDSNSATLSRRLSTGSSASVGRVRKFSDVSLGGSTIQPTNIPAPAPYVNTDIEWMTPQRDDGDDDDDDDDTLANHNPARTFPQEPSEPQQQLDEPEPHHDDDKNTSSLRDDVMDESASFNRMMDGEFERRMSSMNINENGFLNTLNDNDEEILDDDILAARTVSDLSSWKIIISRMAEGEVTIEAQKEKTISDVLKLYKNACSSSAFFTGRENLYHGTTKLDSGQQLSDIRHLAEVGDDGKITLRLEIQTALPEDPETPSTVFEVTTPLFGNIPSSRFSVPHSDSSLKHSDVWNATATSRTTQKTSFYWLDFKPLEPSKSGSCRYSATQCIPPSLRWSVLKGFPRQASITIECNGGKVDVADDAGSFKYTLERVKNDRIVGETTVGGVDVEIALEPNDDGAKLPITVRMMKSKLPALLLLQLVIVFAFADVQSIAVSCVALVLDNILPITYLLILQLAMDPLKSARTFWSIVVKIMTPLVSLFKLLWRRTRKRKQRLSTST